MQYYPLSTLWEYKEAIIDVWRRNWRKYLETGDTDYLDVCLDCIIIILDYREMMTYWILRFGYEKI